MFAGLQGWQLVAIAVIAVLLFAAPKLPAMARSLGQSMRVFSSEVKAMKEEEHAGSQRQKAEDKDGERR